MRFIGKLCGSRRVEEISSIFSSAGPQGYCCALSLYCKKIQPQNRRKLHSANRKSLSFIGVISTAGNLRSLDCLRIAHHGLRTPGHYLVSCWGRYSGDSARLLRRTGFRAGLGKNAGILAPIAEFLSHILGKIRIKGGNLADFFYMPARQIDAIGDGASGRLCQAQDGRRIRAFFDEDLRARTHHGHQPGKVAGCLLARDVNRRHGVIVTQFMIT